MPLKCLGDFSGGRGGKRPRIRNEKMESGNYSTGESALNVAAFRPVSGRKAAQAAGRGERAQGLRATASCRRRRASWACRSGLAGVRRGAPAARFRCRFLRGRPGFPGDNPERQAEVDARVCRRRARAGGPAGGRRLGSERGRAAARALDRRALRPDPQVAGTAPVARRRAAPAVPVRGLRPHRRHPRRGEGRRRGPPLPGGRRGRLRRRRQEERRRRRRERGALAGRPAFRGGCRPRAARGPDAHGGRGIAPGPPCVVSRVPTER